MAPVVGGYLYGSPHGLAALASFASFTTALALLYAVTLGRRSLAAVVGEAPLNQRQQLPPPPAEPVAAAGRAATRAVVGDRSSAGGRSAGDHDQQHDDDECNSSDRIRSAAESAAKEHAA